ncbi:DUF4754 domain-containing protein, partial [Escherichia coli]|nr:DUF4754 domain-containing protein [Escherichia coli]
ENGEHIEPYKLGNIA